MKLTVHYFILTMSPCHSWQHHNHRAAPTFGANKLRVSHNWRLTMTKKKGQLARRWNISHLVFFKQHEPSVVFVFQSAFARGLVETTPRRCFTDVFSMRLRSEIMNGELDDCHHGARDGCITGFEVSLTIAQQRSVCTEEGNCDVGPVWRDEHVSCAECW